jgi:hypothetical protein
MPLDQALILAPAPEVILAAAATVTHAPRPEANPRVPLLAAEELVTTLAAAMTVTAADVLAQSAHVIIVLQASIIVMATQRL